MKLRPAVDADLSELVAVQEAGAVAGLGHIFPQQHYPFPREDVYARWRTELTDPMIRTFVAEEDGRIRGFAATRGEELLHFGTAVDSWGSGLAGRMHDGVLAVFDASIPEVWLWVFEENLRAQRFYARRGWRKTSESKPTSYAPHPALVKYTRPMRQRP